MAVTAKWYTNAFKSMANKLFDLDTTDALTCSLHTTSYTPTQATHDFWNDTTNEVTSSNYTLSGLALTTPTHGVVTTVWSFDSDDPSWSTVTFSPGFAVYYSNTGGASSADPLLTWLDFGGAQAVVAANFTITQDSAGIAKVTVA